MTDEPKPESAIFRYAFGHDEMPPMQVYKIVISIVAAAVIAAVVIAAVAWPKAHVAEHKVEPKPAATNVITPSMAEAGREVPSKGVRIVPIYRKIEERAPMEPAAPTTTTVEKTAGRLAQKADQPLPPPRPDRPPYNEDAAKPEPIPVKPMRVKPTLIPDEPPALELPARRHYGHRSRKLVAETGDICARHGLHKVTSKDGKSWRCK